MLSWENNRWADYTVAPENVLLTIEARLVQIKFGDAPNRSMECALWDDGNFPYLLCRDSVGRTLMFNTATGQLGYSNLYGAITESSNYRDSVVTIIYNCTAF